MFLYILDLFRFALYRDSKCKDDVTTFHAVSLSIIYYANVHFEILKISLVPRSLLFMYANKTFFYQKLFVLNAIRGSFKKFCYTLNIRKLLMLIRFSMVYSYLLRNISWTNEMRSLINHEIIPINATELSTLMSVLGTGKCNFQSHFDLIKLIRQRFRCKGKW